MAFGKISGPMLQPDLARQGVDLSVDTNLVYFDVTNRRLGINTVLPTQALDVPGNVRLANLSILGNTVTSDTGKIDFGAPANIVLSGGTSYDVLYTDGNGNLAFGNINAIAGLDVLTGNNVTLGSNTVGSFGNATTISSTTTVTDAIALINQNAGNITANVTTLLSKVYANANAASYLPIFFSSYTGNINAGNVISTIYGNVHSDVISGNTGNVVTIAGTGALRFPVGSSANRPTGVVGEIRYNSDVAINTVEYFDGTNWIPFQNAITDQQITADGTSTAYNLNQTAATSESVLVSINGTVQRPNSAYIVSGGIITFAEPPASTDIIDIRFITSATTAILEGISENISTTGNITTTGTITASNIVATNSTVTNITVTNITTTNETVGNVTATQITAGNITTDNLQATVLYANTTTVTSLPVTVINANTLVDTFSANSYRSVKYTIQSSWGSQFQVDDLILIQNGTTAHLSGRASRFTANLGTYSSTMSGANVSLYFTPTNATTYLRIHKLQFVL